MSDRTIERLPTSGALTPAAPFDLVRRGYDRQQVEDRLAALAAALAEVRVAQRRESRRADRVERELQHARARLEAQAALVAEGDESSARLGYRLERLMRVAAQQAAEVRSSAAKEATALVERARAEADAHRDHVQQSLMTRTAGLRREAARRGAALDERERQIAEQTAAAGVEAERMLTEARIRADRLRMGARVRARREHDAMGRAIRDREMSAEQELSRLRQLCDEVRGRLGRLLESLETGCGATPSLPLWARQPTHSLSDPDFRPRVLHAGGGG